MSDPAASGQLIWTVLPRGRAGNSLQLSVLLSPRLLASTDGTTVAGNGGDFVDWPAIARGLSFTIDFDNGSTIVASVAGAQSDPSVLDSGAWAALMAPLGIAAVKPVAAPSPVVSFPARENYSNIVAGYRPDPNEQPSAPTPAGALSPATASREAARRRTFSLVAPNADARAQVSAEWRRLAALRRTPSARLLARSPVVPAAQLFFEQAGTYFDRLNAGAQARDGLPPAPLPTLDVHDAVTVYSRYPWLMRQLGLVFDLALDLPAGLPASGRVRVRPAGTSVTWLHATPWTWFQLGDSGFFALANPNTTTVPVGIASGLLVALDDDTSMTMDLDPLIHGVRAAALRFHAEAPTVAPPLPAPRSAGLALARRGMDAVINTMLARQSELATALAQAADGSTMQLYAEDLMRGFRVDIRHPGETVWRSLHQRRGSYRLADGSAFATVDDEGAATLRAFNPEADDNIWTHETLFRWLGWSLSAPRPGRTIGPAGNPIDGSGEGAGNLPLRVSFSALPRSLPRLRFGQTYECRLRVVDLAGNAIAPDAATDALAAPLPLGSYYRFDPLLAPALLMRDAPQPAETVELVVLRSTPDTPAAGNAERWVAPPRCTAQMAEWHGMFDTATGLDHNAYTILVAHDTGFADAPYGAAPPTLPYLPDPLARGAWLLTDAGNLPGGTSSLNLLFAGTWPALDGFRIRLVEGSGGPSWDATQRVLTIALPKGGRSDWLLATALDPGHFTPDDPTSAGDLALFDSWQSIWARPHSVQYRQFQYQHMASGSDEQLTPYRQLSFVHAVSRPLVMPLLDTQRLLASRPFFGTSAVLTAMTPLDTPSTGQVDLFGQWSDPVDDGVNPPSRVALSAHLDRLSVDASVQQPGGNALLTFNHELRDTRHHRMTCWMVAATRYREFFPEITDPAQLTLTSASVTIEVPASAPPARPKVLAVLPVFAFDEPGSSATPAPRRRTGLRVVLDRPWFSSGDDERLGVVMPINPIPDPQFDPGPTPGPRPSTPVRGGGDGVVLVDDPPPFVADALVPIVSQWGIDPLLPGGPIVSPFAPLPRHFKNVRDKAFLFSVQSGGGGEVFNWDRVVVSFDVQFVPPDPSDPQRSADPARDPNDGRWICDLELETGDVTGVPYAPFVRLALVRFQPFAPDAATVLTSGGLPADHQNYAGDMRVSEVVLADFVQFAPERSLSLVGDAADPSRINLVVTGPSYTTNDDTQDAQARPTAVLDVEVQVDIGAPGAPVWVGLATAESTAIAATGLAGLVQWSLSVTLPFARGSRTQRLVLREFECLPADASDDIGTSTIARRLVYSDIIPV
jgi:hypothetical protein